MYKEILEVIVELAKQGGSTAIWIFAIIKGSEFLTAIIGKVALFGTICYIGKRLFDTLTTGILKHNDKEKEGE